MYRNHFKDLVRWIPATIIKKVSYTTYTANINGNIRLVHKNQLRKLKRKLNYSYITEKNWSQNDTLLNTENNYKRKRSESQSPPIRRSDRLKGQPRLKYCK